MSLPILEGSRDWPKVLLARDLEPGHDLAAAQAAGAWSAYRDAVEKLTPEAVISMISESGLRGRGGASYPTGSKWRDCAARPASSTPASRPQPASHPRSASRNWESDCAGGRSKSGAGRSRRKSRIRKSRQ